MPRVCISMVASAFQYGWAPTFTPVTTMFTSPPRWVNSMTRRSTAPIQSMFSVPLSIAILAPDDSVNHSTGTPIRSARSSAAMIRLHSGSAKLPSPRVGSPNSATRVMPSGSFSVSLRRSPTTTLAVFIPYGRDTGMRVPCSSRSCSTNWPVGNRATASAGGVSIRTISYG